LDKRALADYIAHSEGVRQKAYDDGRGNMTIGIGHMFVPGDDKLFGNLFGNKYDVDKLIARTQAMDLDDVYTLFSHDAEEHLSRARQMFPQFDTFPSDVQMALADSVYRGDTGVKTRQLINAGKWGEAAREYLNRHDYANRHVLGIPGIGPRMERNQRALLNQAARTGG
jgi:GH24 family phage-related lysozyme (muramidase)